MRKCLLIPLFSCIIISSNAQFYSIKKPAELQNFTAIQDQLDLENIELNRIIDSLDSSSYLNILIELSEERKDSLLAQLTDENARMIKELQDKLKVIEDPERVIKIINDIKVINTEFGKKSKKLEKKFERLEDALNYLADPRDWFPARNAVSTKLLYDAELFNKNVQSLRNSLFTFDPSGTQASLYNEVISDYLQVGRLSVGTLLGQVGIDSTENQKDITKESAIQRLVGGGGNIVVSYGIPVYNKLANGIRTFISFKPSINSDLPKLGSGVEDFSYHLNLGLEGYVYFTSLQNDFNVFFHGKYSHLSGNQAFKSNLGISNKSFGMGHISAGLTFSQKFKVIFTVYGNSIGDEVELSNTFTFEITP